MAVKEHTDELLIVNSKYRATIKRSKDGKAWLLADHKDEPDDGKGQRRSQCLPWLICGNIYLPDWIADDSFRIQKVEEVGALWRIHFTHDEGRRKTLGKDVAINTASGYIDVEPQFHCRVTSYRFETKTKFSTGSESGTLVYAASAEIPVVMEITSLGETRSERFGNQRSREVRTFKLEYNGKPPEEEFRLSYYDLPEPIGVQWKKTTPTYIWILIAAAIAGGSAVLLGLIARRRSSKVI